MCCGGDRHARLIDYVGRTSISGQHFISGGNAFNSSSNHKLSGFCFTGTNQALVTILNVIYWIKVFLVKGTINVLLFHKSAEPKYGVCL